MKNFFTDWDWLIIAAVMLTIVLSFMAAGCGGSSPEDDAPPGSTIGPVNCATGACK